MKNPLRLSSEGEKPLKKLFGTQPPRGFHGDDGGVVVVTAGREEAERVSDLFSLSPNVDVEDERDYPPNQGNKET